MASASGVTPPISKGALVAAANTLLAGLGSLRLASNADADDVFEYWLWARTIAAARRNHLLVHLSGSPGGWIWLRTTPSSVSSSSYTHAVIRGSRNTIELHTGIYIEGISGARHEVDVAAVTIGAGAGSPVSCRDLHWGMEAKLYATAKALPLPIPRAVLGTAYDLGTLSGYHRRAGGPQMALVSSARLSRNGRRLLAYPGRSGTRVASAESVSTTHVHDVELFVDRQLAHL